MSDITADYSFGGFLRRMRLRQELTLREAAKKLGMDAGNLSKLERSELDPPRSAKRIEQICRKLGIEDGTGLLKSLAFQHHLGILKSEFEKERKS